VKVDRDKAAQLYEQVAEQDHPDAQWFLGLCYEHGGGVPHDMGAAVALYRRAIEGGCVPVNASLGLCFEKGMGVVQSTAEAERLYKLAAKSGSSIFDLLPRGLAKLLKESLSPNATPDTRSPAARARIRFLVLPQPLSEAGACCRWRVAQAPRRQARRGLGLGVGLLPGLRRGARAEDVRQLPHRALLRQGVHRPHVARARGELQVVAHRIRGRRRAKLGG
jgi:hypothetical protein